MSLERLHTFMATHTGLNFQRAQLRHAVNQRMQALGLENSEQYWRLIDPSQPDHQEYRCLVDQLTIKESYFFRQHKQLNLFQRRLLPKIARRGRPLRIWSAGCATGEEPYSIAILLNEALPAPQSWDIVIYATDISTAALVAARRGRYSARAVRNVPASIRRRYFQTQSGQYKIVDDLKAWIRFQYLNLAEEPLPIDHLPIMDFIFCRNVLIYFSPQNTRRLLARFYDQLQPEGYLFPGYSEILRFLSDAFEPVEIDDAFVYRKCRPTQPPTGIRIPKPPRKPNKPRRRPQKSLSAPIRHPSPQQPPPISPSPLEDGDDALQAAMALANSGRVQEAVEQLDRLIAEQPLCIQAYFSLAMIHRRMGHIDASIHYLKKVLYLDPQAYVARLHLADVYRENQDRDQARHHYGVIASDLAVAAADPADPFNQGFSAQLLLDTAQSRLAMLSL